MLQKIVCTAVVSFFAPAWGCSHEVTMIVYTWYFKFDLKNNNPSFFS